MAEDVQHLRDQLRQRGYLTHGIERWFALDPWSSRTFWVELAVVALKAALLLSLFAAIPMVAIMLFRNHPLPPSETVLLTLLYAAFWFAAAFLFTVLLALLFKIRPAVAIDTPRALLAGSILAAGLLVLALGFWWFAFETRPEAIELVTGLALLAIFFAVATIVISAALLSFSIYELHRVPEAVQRPRTIPIAVGAAILVAGLFLPAYAAQQEREPPPPLQVVTSPASRRVVLVAVDGLTSDVFGSRRGLASQFASKAALQPIESRSPAETWATVGSGVRPADHGVRSIEAIRLAASPRAIQSISRHDLVLRHLAPRLRLAARQPLPPTSRRRDFVWEVFAGRGMPSVAVNWWSSSSERRGALETIGQNAIFRTARRRGGAAASAVAVDEEASARLTDLLDRTRAQFGAVYLPGLDILLTRLTIDSSTRLATSATLLDRLTELVGALRQRGYDILLVGMQSGAPASSSAFIASTLPLPASAASPYDVAPTLCTLAGFPATQEMPGRSLVRGETPRIASYGTRAATSTAVKVDEEYYENLKSLGYIR